MHDSGANERETAALSARYERRPDGTLTFVPTETTKDRPKDEFPLTGTRSDGSDPGSFELFVAFCVDLLIHIGVGAAVWLGTNRIGYAIIAALAASIVHRTVIQRLTRTTAGKALFGLKLRRADGSYPSFWRLVGQWLSGSVMTAYAFI